MTTPRSGKSHLRKLTFTSLKEKANWLDAAASFDATEEYVRVFVHTTFARSLNDPEPEAAANAIHDWVRDNIAYVRDFRESVGQAGEEFADSETILKRGFDDCDGKSRLFVALIRASGVRGLQARIRPVFKKHPDRFVHVQAQASYPGSQGWLLAEMILKGVGLGEDPEKAKDASGHYQLANERKGIIK